MSRHQRRVKSRLMHCHPHPEAVVLLEKNAILGVGVKVGRLDVAVVIANVRISFVGSYREGGKGRGRRPGATMPMRRYACMLY